MIETLSKAMIMVMIIIIANILTSRGYFTREKDFDTVSKLIFYVTLPCAIMTNLNGIVFPISMLVISLLGFLFNIIYLGVSWLIGKDKVEKSFLMINMNGYNVGNFTMPFVSFFFSGMGILAVSLFDAGSAVMVLGGNYGMAKAVRAQVEGHKGGRVIYILRSMSQAPALWIYLLMGCMSLLRIQFPPFIIDVTRLAGNANPFLSMFMIGVALDLRLDKRYYKVIIKTLLARYSVAALLAVVVYLCLPFDREIRQVICILVFAPVSAVASMYTRMLKDNFELSAVINSLSIIVSIILMTTLLIVWF